MITCRLRDGGEQVCRIALRRGRQEGQNGSKEETPEFAEDQDQGCGEGRQRPLPVQACGSQKGSGGNRLLDRPRRRGFVVAPGAGRREVDVRHEGDAHVVALGDVGVYAVLVLCDGSPDT